MKIQLSSDEINGSEALEILTGHIHVEISFYTRKMDAEADQNTIAGYASIIRDLQKCLFEAAAFTQGKSKVKLDCYAELS